MFLAEAGCLFVAFMLYISGVQGRANRICALKGSSVNLPCSAEHPTSSLNWYTGRWNGLKFARNDFVGDGNRTRFNMSGESNFTLMMDDLRHSDSNSYCCGTVVDNAGHCWFHRIQLHVADLQVKVIPSTEGQTVTLMCSTSCPLTENPAAYIWYKNGEVLYQDWSPWYQELVGSEEAVRYSCAIKGYEDLRAPEVSVDSVTSTCFTVTYAKGRMCSYKQMSEDEPCTITYPTEVHVQRTPLGEEYVRMTCTPSCALTDPHTTYRWYRNKRLYQYHEGENFTAPTSSGFYSCAVKGHEDLRAAEVCDAECSCSGMNYASRRICAVEGSSVNISYECSHLQEPHFKVWYKIKRSDEDDVEEPTADAGDLEYHDMNRSHILRFKKLRMSDSGEYAFRFRRDDYNWKQSNFPGVTLVVTGLKVIMTPSTEVTEGQRVTLSCSTSCPLNTNYIWSFNSRPLTLSETQSKHLVLDPVSSQHAGNYSCSVETDQLRSPEVSLTVQVQGISMAIINAIRLTVALLILVLLLLFHL